MMKNMMKNLAPLIERFDYTFSTFPPSAPSTSDKFELIYHTMKRPKFDRKSVQSY